MKRIIAGLILGISSLILPADKSNAHQFDAYSYWYCSLHRSDSSATVIHSDVWAIHPGTIVYWCIQDVHFFGVTHQYFVGVTPPFSGNSYRDSGYQNCNLVTCQGH